MDNSIIKNVLNKIHRKLHVCHWQLAPLLDMGIRRWAQSPEKNLIPYIKAAKEAGFKTIDSPPQFLNRTMLFQK